MRADLSYKTTKKNEVIPITKDFQKLLKKSGIKNGTIIAYSIHTTVSLIVQEAVEPKLCEDIVEQLTEIVENDGSKYKHTCADHPKGLCKIDNINGPSHVRQLLTNQNLVIDVADGKMILGEWQDIALLELDGPRNNRTIHVKIEEDR